MTDDELIGEIGRIWDTVFELRNVNDRLLAENSDLHKRLEETESTADSAYCDLAELKELVRKIQWCVENGVRG